MNSNLSTISFDDVFKKLKFAATTIKKTTDTKPIDELISPLITICSTVGSNKPYTPLYVPEEYVRQWKVYLLQNEKPNTRAVRYLCWEPDVASNKKFLDFLHREQITLSARSLQGIVRACHKQWASVLKDSVLKKGSVIEQIRGMVRAYEGPNRILSKWNASLDAVLSSKGPELFAADMLTDSKTIKEQTESWAVEVQSAFFLNSMLHAVQQCRHDIDRCRYLFTDLFPWPLWDAIDKPVFKKMISEVILDDYYNNEAAREMLQRFVLSDSRLGDPRLPKNNWNWIGIDEDARGRFIQWLSKANISFFFEHVLPIGRDPNKRKDFWLRYINRYQAARSLLCSQDEMRLQTTLARDREKVGHFGRIRGGINSAFLLDFGSFIVVEFSKIGRCYIYEEREFKNRFPDFWTNKVFEEYKLKNKKLPDERRIVHRISVNVDWRDAASTILARYGIRL